MDFGTVLFLPLLGGYIFFTRFNGTRFRASSFPAQRLIFPSAAFGLVFLSIARGIQIVSEEAGKHPESWRRLAFGGLMPGAAVASIAIFAFVLLRFDREAAAAAKTADGIDPLRQLIIRGGSLFLLATGVLVLGVATDSRSVIDQLLACTVHSIAITATTVAIAYYLTRITNWPVLGLMLRTVTSFLVIAVIFALIIYFGSDVESCWVRFVNNDTVPGLKLSGVPAVSLVVALATWKIANNVLDPLAAASYQSGSDRADPLKQLLYQSLIENKLIEVTLDSDKVYIGWVSSQPPHSESADGYFVLLPVRSGYRTKDTRELEITTRYEQIFQQMIDEAELAHAEIPSFEDFQKILPLAAVSSAGLFDPIAYERFALAPGKPVTMSESKSKSTAHSYDREWRSVLDLD